MSVHVHEALFCGSQHSCGSIFIVLQWCLWHVLNRIYKKNEYWLCSSEVIIFFPRCIGICFFRCISGTGWLIEQIEILERAYLFQKNIWTFAVMSSKSIAFICLDHDQRKGFNEIKEKSQPKQCVQWQLQARQELWYYVQVSGDYANNVLRVVLWVWFLPSIDTMSYLPIDVNKLGLRLYVHWLLRHCW